MKNIHRLTDASKIILKRLFKNQHQSGEPIAMPADGNTNANEIKQYKESDLDQIRKLLYFREQNTNLSILELFMRDYR